MSTVDRSITCPCNNRTVVIAATPDRRRYVAACPQCKAQTIPMPTQASALRVWVAMRSESVKDSVPT